MLALAIFLSHPHLMSSFLFRRRDLSSPLASLCLHSFVMIQPANSQTSGGYDSSSSSSSSSTPYLADFEATSAADLMETEVRDYEQVNNPLILSSSSPSPVSTGATSEPYHKHQQHHYQQTDIPLQLSDILPTDRRSYDKMEPPKKEGTHYDFGWVSCCL